MLRLLARALQALSQTQLRPMVDVFAMVVREAVESRWRGPCGQPDGQPDGRAAPAHRLPTRLTTLSHSGSSGRVNITSDV